MDPLPHVQAEQQASNPPPRSLKPPDMANDEFAEVYGRLRAALMRGQEAFTRALQACEQDPAYGFDLDYVNRQLNFAHKAVTDATIHHVCVHHFSEFLKHAEDVEHDQDVSRYQSANGKSVAATEGGAS